MAGLFPICLLVVFRLGTVFGSDKSECIQRQEFETRLGQLERRLFKEIQLRQNLEAKIKDMKSVLDEKVPETMASDAYLKNVGSQRLNVMQDNMEEGRSLEMKRNEQFEPLEEGKHTPETSASVIVKPEIRQLKQQKRVIQSSGVKEAFTVELVHDLNSLGLSQPIRFDSVISNLGNGFNTRTGIFTATFPGWYVFTLTMMTTLEMEIYILRDGAIIARCYELSKDVDSTTQTVVTHLYAGSEIWVQTHPTVTLSQKVVGQHHTTFTGFLLYAD